VQLVRHCRFDSRREPKYDDDDDSSSSLLQSWMMIPWLTWQMRVCVCVCIYMTSYSLARVAVEFMKEQRNDHFLNGWLVGLLLLADRVSDRRQYTRRLTLTGTLLASS
jgi:hypothetical protein